MTVWLRALGLHSRRVVLHHGVEDREQLTHHGRHHYLEGLTGSRELPGEGLGHRVVARETKKWGQSSLGARIRGAVGFGHSADGSRFDGRDSSGKRGRAEAFVGTQGKRAAKLNVSVFGGLSASSAAGHFRGGFSWCFRGWR